MRKIDNAEFFGLISLAMSPADLEGRDPTEFREFADVVQMIKNDPKEGLRYVLKRAAGLEWDKVQRSMTFGVEQFARSCEVEYQFRASKNEFKEVNEAYAYIEGHKQLTNLEHAPGSDVLVSLEKARQTILKMPEKK